MNKINKIIILIPLCFFCLDCDFFQSSSQTAQVGKNEKVNANSKTTQIVVEEAKIEMPISEDSSDEREIKSCLPEKLYRGDTVEIVLTKNHGGNLAVYREPRENFYFLSSTEKGSSPILSEDDVIKASSIKLNTETTLKTNYRKTKSVDEYLIDRVFNKTGWYRIIIGHQGLDVDFEDMPWTGMCRIYYVNKNRPHNEE